MTIEEMKQIYQLNPFDNIPDENMIDEAIATLEAFMSRRTEEQLKKRSRDLVIPYLALLIAKEKLK